jgi:nicotinamidase-related amidase
MCGTPRSQKRELYFDRQLRELVLPNLQKLIEAFRNAKAEVMYTVMENLTEDGRDRSLDTSSRGSGLPRAHGTRRCSTSSGLAMTTLSFRRHRPGSSTRRTSRICCAISASRRWFITGFLTDQCVDHTVRDAADRGFYPICVTDGCATYSQDRHDHAIELFKGYCRRMTTAETLAWIRGKKSGNDA